MKARTLRCASALAVQAAARIREGGRVPPDSAELLAALLPSAKGIMRTARWLEWAAAEHQRALDGATQAVSDAESVMAGVVSDWLARAPETGTVAAEFESIVAASLADVDQAGEPQ